MSLPYFPMFPSDFEAKTSHLTLEEDGAYNRLLRIMWMTPGCSVPDDDAWILRRMRVDEQTYERVVLPVIAEFCVREDGRVSNARLTRVFIESSSSHKKRVEAGKRGGIAKALKHTNKAPSIAKAMLWQPEPEPEVKKELAKASSKEKRGSRLSAEWILPPEWAEFGTIEGLDAEAVRREADRFRDYWISVPGQRGIKRDWQATWRNWIRKTAEDNRKRKPDKAQPRMGERRVSPSGKVFDWEGDVRGWVAVHQ